LGGDITNSAMQRLLWASCSSPCLVDKLLTLPARPSSPLVAATQLLDSLRSSCRSPHHLATRRIMAASDSPFVVSLNSAMQIM
jgi:hypothetical protein